MKAIYRERATSDAMGREKTKLERGLRWDCSSDRRTDRAGEEKGNLPARIDVVWRGRDIYT